MCADSHAGTSGSLPVMARTVTLDHVAWSASTDDEVPIALDGRRLDTKEKVLAFLAEVNAGRSAEPASGVG
jgi:hypothetical protein